MKLKSDTDPRAEAVLIEGYRRMDPSKKLHLAMAMSQTVINLTRDGIYQRYPGISTEEARKRLGAILLGRELSIKVNNWDPEKEGY